MYVEAIVKRSLTTIFCKRVYIVSAKFIYQTSSRIVANIVNIFVIYTRQFCALFARQYFVRLIYHVFGHVRIIALIKILVEIFRRQNLKHGDFIGDAKFESDVNHKYMIQRMNYYS